MKSIAAILFSFLVLSQSLGLGVADVVRIGDLVEHARYHNETYGDNFSDFLAKHYGDLKADHTHNENNREQEHEELPFQHAGCHHLVVEHTSLAFISLPEKIVVSSEEKTSFYYLDLYASLERSDIFQPPKQA